jgi:uncharacterized protein (TIGR02678 family)
VNRLQTRLERQAADEQARAIRSLLGSPLLVAEQDPAAFDLVRRHAQALREWFDDVCGWALHVEPRRGYARLVKVRPDPDPSRPARRLRSTRAPFDRRRYTILCLIAAELARPGAMTTIGLLAERVRAASTAEAVIETFDTAARGERAAFVDGLKLLERYGVVRAVDGTTDAFLDSADAKVLYQVDESRLTGLVAAPTPPSRLGDEPDLKALLHEPRYGDAPEGDSDVPDVQRHRWLRHSLCRRLLDDPVVYFADLSEAQRNHLASPTGRRLMRRVAALAGLTLEERAEGLLAIDPDALATDAKFPDEHSHAKHAALLLLETLDAGRSDRAPVPMGLLIDRVTDLLGRFPSWAKAYQSDGGAARLAAEAVDLLQAFGLAAREGDLVRALPAAARYQPPPGEALQLSTSRPAPPPHHPRERRSLT